MPRYMPGYLPEYLPEGRDHGEVGQVSGGEHERAGGAGELREVPFELDMQLRGASDQP